MPQAAASQQEQATRVVVFTTAGCPHCKRAKGVLQDENVAYAEVDVSGDSQLRQELQSITGQGTVPQAIAKLMLLFLYTIHALGESSVSGTLCPCNLGNFVCVSVVLSSLPLDSAGFLWQQAHWRRR